MKLPEMIRRLRPAGVAALAALALSLSLAAAPCRAAEGGEHGKPMPPVSVGDFSFTPPADMREGTAWITHPGLRLSEGADATGLSPLYSHMGSGRNMQFYSARRGEKELMLTLAAVVVPEIRPGNIHSLGGSFWYDETLNRTVSVHSAAMIEALDTVYDAGHLVEEMNPVDPR